MCGARVRSYARLQISTEESELEKKNPSCRRCGSNAGNVADGDPTLPAEHHHDLTMVRRHPVPGRWRDLVQLKQNQSLFREPGRDRAAEGFGTISASAGLDALVHQSPELARQMGLLRHDV